MLHAFLPSVDFFLNQLFQKIFQEFQLASVSKSMDLDQAGRFHGPHRSGPNCLQMLSAVDIKKESGKA